MPTSVHAEVPRVDCGDYGLTPTQKRRTTAYVEIP